MMFPIIQLGSFAISVPLLTLLVGVWASAWAIEKEARSLTLASDAMTRLVLIGLAAGIVGARLGYAARAFEVYRTDPLGLVSFTPTALDPQVGLLIGSVVALVYARRRNLLTRLMLDALAPGVGIMAVALSLAALASGDAFGAPARLPWSIYLWGAYRHPTQLYALLAALGGLALWWWARRRSLADGMKLTLVVAWLAAAATFIEAFRGDSSLTLGGIRQTQVWALLILALCVWGFYRWRNQLAAGKESTP